MSLFERYEEGKEQAFRDQFVKPLLNRLGFFGVEEQHGINEFGKDFVFSELHRLGGVRHHGAQVKHEETIREGKRIDDLLSQIRQMFATPFRRADSPHDCHVSSVYVFNSGGITDNAKKQMLDMLRREHFGDNAHFLDGDRLEALNQWATYQSDREVRSRLLGLRQQLEANKTIINHYLHGSYHGRLLWAGIEQLMNQPIEPSSIDMSVVYRFWRMGRDIDRCVDGLFGGILIEKVVKANKAMIQNSAPQFMNFSNAIRDMIDATLKRLQPIT